MKRILHAVSSAAICLFSSVAAQAETAAMQSGTSPGAMTLNEIDNRLLSYKRWSDLARNPQDSKVGAGKRQVTEGKYVCDEEDFDLTSTPKEVVLFGANEAALWPGALWQGGPYIDYQIEQLPLQPRASLTLTSTLPISDPSVVVESPSDASMTQAVETLRGRAVKEGVHIGAKASFDSREAYSMEQLTLDLGISAKFTSQQAKASLEWKQSVEQKTIAAYFVQNMFTVSVPPPVTPSAFFAGVTLSDIEDQEKLGRMGSDNPPLYVESVTYGRLLLFTFTSTASHAQMKAALEYAYRGGAEVDAKAKAEYEKILSSSQIRVVPYGGPWESAAKLIKSAKLNEYFNEQDAPLSTAVPISYRLNTLARGKSAAVAETTKYTQKDCHIASEPTVKMNDKVYLQYVGDKRYISIAEWLTPGDALSKKPYPTLRQKAVPLLLRGNGEGMQHGSRLRFSTLEDKAQGRSLGKDIELGAWNAKSRVFYSAPESGIKQDWTFLKSCKVKKQTCDATIRYGDAIYIRSVKKPDEYLCNEHDSQFVNTAKATCTWRFIKP